MSSILSREEQLTRLRADRYKELYAEQNVVALAITHDLLPFSTRYLFEAPGQFPGWHKRIVKLLIDLSKISDRARYSHFKESNRSFILEPTGSKFNAVAELDLILGAYTDAMNICCICGEPRGTQKTSQDRWMCDVCTSADIMLSSDPDASAHREWSLAAGQR